MTISNEAVEAAKEAMREVTPPPGVTKGDWLARHGSFALIAGALEAAAGVIRAEARAEVIAEMLEDADAESKHANWQNERHTANLVHDWLRTWDDAQ